MGAHVPVHHWCVLVRVLVVLFGSLVIVLMMIKGRKIIIHNIAWKGFILQFHFFFLGLLEFNIYGIPYVSSFNNVPINLLIHCMITKEFFILQMQRNFIFQMNISFFLSLFHGKFCCLEL